ncbi:MAG: hypothetical protein LBR29_09410 [Methylobacteriaceae bacterium]|jgi:hypothetical protein|nr:hypothetical protein [Methylobacteriaceae bacterium]
MRFGLPSRKNRHFKATAATVLAAVCCAGGAASVRAETLPSLTIDVQNQSGRTVPSGSSLTVTGATTLKSRSSTGDVYGNLWGIVSTGGPVDLNSVTGTNNSGWIVTLAAWGTGAELTAKTVDITTQLVRGSVGFNTQNSAFGIRALDGGVINITGGGKVSILHSASGDRAVNTGWSNIAMLADDGAIYVGGLLTALSTENDSPAIVATGGGGLIEFYRLESSSNAAQVPGLQVGREPNGAGDIGGAGTIRIHNQFDITTHGEDSPGIYVVGSAYWGSTRISTLTAGNKDVRSTVLAEQSAALVVDSDQTQTGGSPGGVSVTLYNTELKSGNSDSDLIIAGGGLTGGSSLTLRANSYAEAPANGYLLNMSGYDYSEYDFKNLATTQSGELSFRVDDSTIVGSINTNVNAGQVLKIEMSNNALWRIVGKNGALDQTSSFSSLFIKGGAVIDASAGENSLADFTLAGNVSSDAATIKLQDGQVGDVLTIQGDYHGYSYGWDDAAVISLDTHLGDDDSETDLVRFQGDVGGQTLVDIRPQEGSQGADTLSNGIKILQVDGSAPEDAFELVPHFRTDNGWPAVVVGAYAYTLW